MFPEQQALRDCALLIGRKYNKPPVRGWRAFRKLFVAPRWIGNEQHGHKPGELLEWAFSFFSQEEWGDVGYYVAQMPWPCWVIYRLVTSREYILRAVAKFENRAYGD